MMPADKPHSVTVETEGTIELGFRAVWENFDVLLQMNMPLRRPGTTWDHDGYSCPHVVDNTLPRVVVAYNEGGYNSVGICADCLIEALQKVEGANYE